MSNHKVNCTIVNKTDYGISVSTFAPDGANSGMFNQYHGEFTTYPIAVDAGQTVTAFQAEKSSSMSDEGTTGFVSYNLNNGQQLIIIFSRPYDPSNGSYNNSYAYALIQGPSGGTTFADNVTYLTTSTQNYYAEVSPFTNSSCNPSNPDPLEFTVTLYSN